MKNTITSEKFTRDINSRFGQVEESVNWKEEKLKLSYLRKRKKREEKRREPEGSTKHYQAYQHICIIKRTKGTGINI